MPDYAHPESLVSTAWLADRLDTSHAIVVEIVWGDSAAFGRAAYDRGHVPGAVAWDFENDLQDPGRRDIVGTAGIERLLSSSGITATTTIVVYSGLDNLLATYAFWLLKVYRHRDVRLLDGGKALWLAEGRPTTTTAPGVVPAVYRALEPDRDVRADRTDILWVIGREDHSLVDARSAEMYRGQDAAGAARGGHIPGALNLAAVRETHSDGSFKSWRVPTVRPDGTFKAVAALQALCTDLGLLPERTIITYCVRGGLSTHAWFVLTQLLGYPRVREYDRSWAEWGNLAAMPVEV